MQERALTGTLDECIGDEMAEGPNDMLTRWVVIAEFIDENGSKYVTREYESSMAQWDVDALMMHTDFED